MLMNRRPPRRLALYLPPINPQLSPPTISTTIDATISLSPHSQKLYSPKWYASVFKHFQKDLSANKLQTEFDQMIDCTLASRNLEQSGICQDQFVKQVSNQVKIKLFQSYLKKKKKEAGKGEKTTKERERSWNGMRSRTRIDSSLRRIEKQVSEDRSNRSSQRIFGIEGMFKHQEPSVSTPRGKKYKNFRLYHQTINPIHLINP